MTDSPLFTPFALNRLTLKNRVVFAAMSTCLADTHGAATPAMREYYALRAKGGAGLVMVESTAVDKDGRMTGWPRLDDDRYIAGLYDVAESIHAHGAAAFLQLNHAGAAARGKNRVSSGKRPMPEGPFSENAPSALTQDGMLLIAEHFAVAAARARQAGFDGVEINAGHSFLLAQFLSPLFNGRKDDYGGSAANRARFPAMVLAAVRVAVGPFFPVGLLVGADEMTRGGNALDDTLELLPHISDFADYISVSAGSAYAMQYMADKIGLADGWKAGMAKAVKERTGRAVMVAGNIRTTDRAERILEEGSADLVGIGRGLLADPFWPAKVAAGREESIRRCISCNIGCSDNVLFAKPIRCTVNPDVIHEDAHTRVRNNEPCRVAVVGGGTAGLEAACTAAEMGCETHLFEKKQTLGGLSTFISQLPEKARIAGFTDYLVNRAQCLKTLHFHLGKAATIPGLEALDPDVVVAATGSRPFFPPITGLMPSLGKRDSSVVSVFGFINRMETLRDMSGMRVVVIGGGAVGLDVVEHCALHGAASITIVEMMDAVGAGLDFITRQDMLTMLAEHDVAVMTRTALAEVQESLFIVLQGDKTLELPFDLGVICLGMRADTSMYAGLEAFAREKGRPYLSIGDGRLSRRLIDGVREGREVRHAVEQVRRKKRETCEKMAE